MPDTDRPARGGVAEPRLRAIDRRRRRPPNRSSARSRRCPARLERNLRGWLDGAAPPAALASSPAPARRAGRRPAPPGRGPRRGPAAARHHAHGRHRRRQIDAAQRPGRRRRSPRRRSPGRPPATRSSTTTSRSSPTGSTRPCGTAGSCRTTAPTLEQKVIVDTPDLDSNDLANREKLQGPAAGRRRRALRRLAGEVPRPARLGPVPGAAAAAGVRVRAQQVGPLPARRRPPACGPTRTCSAT